MFKRLTKNATKIVNMERMKRDLKRRNIDWNFIPDFESYFDDNKEYDVILTNILKENQTNLEKSKSVLSNDILNLVEMFPNLQQDVIIQVYNRNNNSKYTKEAIMNSTITELEELNPSQQHGNSSHSAIDMATVELIKQFPNLPKDIVTQVYNTNIENDPLTAYINTEIQLREMSSSPPSSSPSSSSSSPSMYNKKDLIEGKYKDGKWYPGRFVKVADDGKKLIIYYDSTDFTQYEMDPNDVRRRGSSRNNSNISSNNSNISSNNSNTSSNNSNTSSNNSNTSSNPNLTVIADDLKKGFPNDVNDIDNAVNNSKTVKDFVNNLRTHIEGVGIRSILLVLFALIIAYQSKYKGGGANEITKSIEATEGIEYLNNLLKNEFNVSENTIDKIEETVKNKGGIDEIVEEAMKGGMNSRQRLNKGTRRLGQSKGQRQMKRVKPPA